MVLPENAEKEKIEAKVGEWRVEHHHPKMSEEAAKKLKRLSKSNNLLSHIN